MNEKEEICIGAFSIQKKREKLIIIYHHFYKILYSLHIYISSFQLLVRWWWWWWWWCVINGRSNEIFSIYIEIICTHIFLSHISVSSDFVCMCVYVQFINYVNRSVRENLLYIFFSWYRRAQNIWLDKFFFYCYLVVINHLIFKIINR